jgi:hypothetical protein
MSNNHILLLFVALLETVVYFLKLIIRIVFQYRIV